MTQRAKKGSEEACLQVFSFRTTEAEAATIKKHVPPGKSLSVYLKEIIVGHHASLGAK